MVYVSSRLETNGGDGPLSPSPWLFSVLAFPLLLLLSLNRRHRLLEQFYG